MSTLIKTALFFLSCSLYGCGQDEYNDLQHALEVAGKEASSKIEPLPGVQKVEIFEYKQEDLVDPFQIRNLRPANKNEAQPDLDRPRQPLEDFPLDALRMVGTLEKPRQPLSAVIKGPKGTLYPVTIGTRIGQNHGKVTKILINEIEIAELMQDSNGDWIESKAVMSLMENAQ